MKRLMFCVLLSGVAVVNAEIADVSPEQAAAIKTCTQAGCESAIEKTIGGLQSIKADLAEGKTADAAAKVDEMLELMEKYEQQRNAMLQKRLAARVSDEQASREGSSE